MVERHRQIAAATPPQALAVIVSNNASICWMAMRLPRTASVSVKDTSGAMKVVLLIVTTPASALGDTETYVADVRRNIATVAGLQRLRE